MAISVETLALAKNYANKKVEETLSSVYEYKGSVDNFEDLPLEGNKVGDTYNVLNEGGQNYSWTGSEWDALGVNQEATEDSLGLVKLATVEDLNDPDSNKVTTAPVVAAMFDAEMQTVGLTYDGVTDTISFIGGASHIIEAIDNEILNGFY